MSIEVGCRGFIGRPTTSYLTRLGLTNRARRRAHSSFKQQRKGHPAGSGPKSERAPQHDKIALLPLSFLTHTPPHPNPTLPTHPLPPPATPIPIPSSAYRASRSTCSPQWHHPVAEAAGGARVWGTTGSLTHSGRWLTRVMSRQLVLRVVCIYYYMQDNYVYMKYNYVYIITWSFFHTSQNLCCAMKKLCSDVPSGPPYYVAFIGYNAKPRLRF